MKSMKRLGLAVVAAVALTAFVSAASASAAVEFHATQASAALMGEQEGGTTHKFTIAGSSVVCNKAEVTGTWGANKTEPTMTLAPKYGGGCTAFGFAGATVDTSGCKLKFYASNGNVDLESCVGGAATIHVSAFFGMTTCHVTVFNQPGITGNTFSPNSEATKAKNLKLTTASKNIEYKVDESKGLCPLTKNQQAKTGEYSGKTEITGNGDVTEFWVA